MQQDVWANNIKYHAHFFSMIAISFSMYTESATILMNKNMMQGTYDSYLSFSSANQFWSSCRSHLILPIPTDYLSQIILVQGAENALV